MLKKLHVENFALIDECHLDFYPGFTAFTGETGAGKSLLIDAISLLCGERASASFVQRGKNKAVLSGEFTVSPSLKNHYPDLFVDSDVLKLQREITIDGKSTVRINGKAVSLQLLKSVTANLIDIHSQHDTQYLLNKHSHLALLDKTLADNSLLELTATLWKNYSDAKKRLDQFMNTSLTESDAEMLRYEINEIESAHLSINEDQELEERLKTIQSFEKIYDKLNHAIELFEKDNGADELLYEINSDLSLIHEVTQIKELAEQFHEKYYDLKDLVEQLKDFKDQQSYDEQEINDLHARLFEIGRLKRKYGRKIEDILNHRIVNLELLDTLEHRQSKQEELEAQLERTYSEFLDAAKKLSNKRKQAAAQLEKTVVEQLRDLMLPYAQFSVDFNEFEGNSTGIDDVEFLISLNPQELLRPLKMVASGGELSRLMLGLKTIFTALQGISCVIFDEIDTGVSGAVATSIGLKMSLLSKSAQVFSVTHLAQVASCAAQHVFVKKSLQSDRSAISIGYLNEQERIEQLAMISNGALTDVSLSAAVELYQTNQHLSGNS